MELVSKEINKKLPRGERFAIRFTSFYFRYLWKYFNKQITWCPHFILKMRGANFMSINIGPIEISWAKRWILEIAEYEHPEVFEEKEQ